MNRIIVSIFLVAIMPASGIFLSSAFAVSGEIWKDEVWRGEVLVTGDVVINEGVSLTVMPGTRINFSPARSDYDHVIMRKIAGESKNILSDGKCDIIVKGVLKAAGTIEDMISIGRTSVGWGGIFFFGDNRDSLLSFCDMLNANIAVFCWDSSRPMIGNNIIRMNNFGLIFVDSSSPEVSNNVISYNKFGIGIYDSASPKISGNRISKGKMIGVGTRDSSNPRMTDNTIRDNDIGIAVYDSSSPDIYNNEIVENNLGIFSIDSSMPRIKGNLITKNRTAGIQVRGMSAPEIKDNKIEENAGGIVYNVSSAPAILGNVFRDNKEEVVMLSGEARFIVSGEIKKNTVWQNSVHVAGDVLVNEGVVLTINPGTRITFEPNKSKNDYTIIRQVGNEDMNAAFDGRCDIIVKGTLRAAGNSKSMIRIGNPDMSSSGDRIGWGSIIFLGKGEDSILDRVTVQYASIGIFCWDETKPRILNGEISNNKIGIDCSGNSSPQINGNTIHSNDTYGAVCVDNSSPYMVNNKFVKNIVVGIGVKNSSSPDIRENEIRESRYGLDCSGSSRPRILDNVITVNKYGVESYDSAVPYIEGNRFTNNEKAVVFKDSSSPELRNNVFENNARKVVRE